MISHSAVGSRIHAASWWVTLTNAPYSRAFVWNWLKPIDVSSRWPRHGHTKQKFYEALGIWFFEISERKKRINRHDDHNTLQYSRHLSQSRNYRVLAVRDCRKLRECSGQQITTMHMQHICTAWCICNAMAPMSIRLSQALFRHRRCRRLNFSMAIKVSFS